MIPAQALGALEAGEARLFDEHLDECRECRAELADITDTVALLALDAAPVEPPDAIRDRILDFAKSTAPSGRPTRDERPPNVTSIARPRTVDSVPARPTSS